MNHLNISRIIDKLLRLPNPQKTYLEIIRVHSKEVPLANLLAYYFKDNESHGLGQLFIKSLLATKYYQLDVLKSPKSVGQLSTLLGNLDEQTRIINTISNISVQTEVPTKLSDDKSKRIDILIETNHFVICVEFKINHELNNPLLIYRQHVFEKFKKTNKKILFIVLTPFKKNPSKELSQKYINENKEFKQVILSHFIDNITSSSEYKNNDAVFFNDFIQTIRNREIKSLRSTLLKSLMDYMKSNLYTFVFHSNNRGGFLEYKSNNYRYKIRIHDGYYQIEKWNQKMISKELISLTTEIETLNEKIINTLGTSTLETETDWSCK